VTFTRKHHVSTLTMPGAVAQYQRASSSIPKRQEGLSKYSLNWTSEQGEDGIIRRIFQLLPSLGNEVKYCVDVGARDGRQASRTNSLLVPTKTGEEKTPFIWCGFLMESDPDAFYFLRNLHAPLGNQCLNVQVSAKEASQESLASLLQKHTTRFPVDFDLLAVDAQGSDYWILHNLWTEGRYYPKVICVGFNNTKPNDIGYVPNRMDNKCQGASLTALVELAQQNGYELIHTTDNTAFFVQHYLYHEYVKSEVPDTRIETLHRNEAKKLPRKKVLSVETDVDGVYETPSAISSKRRKEEPKPLSQRIKPAISSEKPSVKRKVSPSEEKRDVHGLPSTTPTSQVKKMHAISPSHKMLPARSTISFSHAKRRALVARSNATSFLKKSKASLKASEEKQYLPMQPRAFVAKKHSPRRKRYLYSELAGGQSEFCRALSSKAAGTSSGIDPPDSRNGDYLQSPDKGVDSYETLESKSFHFNDNEDTDDIELEKVRADDPPNIETEKGVDSYETLESKSFHFNDYEDTDDIELEKVRADDPPNVETEKVMDACSSIEERTREIRKFLARHQMDRETDRLASDSPPSDGFDRIFPIDSHLTTATSIDESETEFNEERTRNPGEQYEKFPDLYGYRAPDPSGDVGDLSNVSYPYGGSKSFDSTEFSAPGTRITDSIPTRAFVPEAFLKSMAIDMSAYCVRKRSSAEEKQVCADRLTEQLHTRGFALIRGTGISMHSCQDALKACHSFLQDADEPVRRSCLAGGHNWGYSPMCSETCKKDEISDMARKFRMGCSDPTDGENDYVGPSGNVWPKPDWWDEEACDFFRGSIEEYYQTALPAAHSIFCALCDGASNQLSFTGISKACPTKSKKSGASVLSLLGFRKGSRHIGQKQLMPAFAEEGALTLLLVDGGDCAIVQREDKPGGWKDVTYPQKIPDDPIFIVSSGDFLRDFTKGYFPSNSHRVIPVSGTIPLNALSLSLRIDPTVMLNQTKDAIVSERMVAPMEDLYRNTLKEPEQVEDTTELKSPRSCSSSSLKEGTRKEKSAKLAKSVEVITVSSSEASEEGDFPSDFAWFEPALFVGLDQTQRSRLIDQIVKLEDWRKEKKDLAWDESKLRHELNRIATKANLTDSPSSEILTGTFYDKVKSSHLASSRKGEKPDEKDELRLFEGSRQSPSKPYKFSFDKSSALPTSDKAEISQTAGFLSSSSRHVYFSVEEHHSDKGREMVTRPRGKIGSSEWTSTSAIRPTQVATSYSAQSDDDFSARFDQEIGLLAPGNPTFPMSLFGEDDRSFSHRSPTEQVQTSERLPLSSSYCTPGSPTRPILIAESSNLSSTGPISRIPIRSARGATASSRTPGSPTRPIEVSERESAGPYARTSGSPIRPIQDSDQFRASSPSPGTPSRPIQVSDAGDKRTYEQAKLETSTSAATPRVKNTLNNAGRVKTIKSLRHYEADGRKHATLSLEGDYSSEVEERSEEALRSIEEALRSLDFRGEQKSASSSDIAREEIEDKPRHKRYGAEEDSRARFASAIQEKSESKNDSTLFTNYNQSASDEGDFDEASDPLRIKYETLTFHEYRRMQLRSKEAAVPPALPTLTHRDPVVRESTNLRTGRSMLACLNIPAPRMNKMDFTASISSTIDVIHTRAPACFGESNPCDSCAIPANRDPKARKNPFDICSLPAKLPFTPGEDPTGKRSPSPPFPLRFTSTRRGNIPPFSRPTRAAAPYPLDEPIGGRGPAGAIAPNAIKASAEVFDVQDRRGLRYGQKPDIREGHAESQGSTSMAPPKDSGWKPTTSKPSLEVKNRSEGHTSEEYNIPDRTEAADVVNSFHDNNESEYVGGPSKWKAQRRLLKNETAATSGRSRRSTKSRLSLQSEKTSVCSSYYLNPDPQYFDRKRQMPERRDPEASTNLSPKPIEIYGTPGVSVSRNDLKKIAASPSLSEVSELTDEQGDLCMGAWFTPEEIQ
jgi:isopenicillin N synthase-like dioxygenase